MNEDVKRLGGSKKISYKVSLGGVAASVCLGMMFLTSVFPLLNLTLVLFAGMVLMAVAIEVNTAWALAAYAAAAVLSVFITPDKEAAILFIMFFGYYPVIRRILVKIKPKAVSWLIRFAVFNVSVLSAYYIIINVFGIFDFMEEFGFLKKYAAPVIIIVINLIFIFYDFTAGVMLTAYMKWFRPTFLRKINKK